MKPKVYIETTIPSYLTARPTRDLVTVAHQQITGEWWARRDRFDLYVSQVVLQEAGGGDPEAAAQRVRAVENLPALEVVPDAIELGNSFIAEGVVPRKAAVDALHIGIATVHGMDYLLTWNCKHIANAVMRARIEWVCREAGYEPAVICTPEELMED